MGLGRLLHRHEEHADHGGTIDHPRAYGMGAALGFLGRRREVFTRLATRAGVRTGDRVLDVGCGTGYLTRIVAPIAAEVTGVDPSPPMVEHARSRAPGNCAYLVGEGQALALPDGSFDVVMSTLAVHHIPAGLRGAAVREMFRVLRPGGRLLIAEFRPPNGRLAGRLMRSLTGPAMRHSPRDLLGDLIPAAGFRVEGEGELSPMIYYVTAVRPT
ncbi:class I SAM-dependent methyltransferase [Nonomuraea endophytica]|uniref:Ubiquinone/menaquinone biosynthesis C-methylase UbiE n=1 Tax=Nonomuraea endophytica TaxID=714136 RepID=A0A7W8AD67_9ACTN|nr:class I SAM-dependent methyltransferase [Nonomuraea endophytica]MBB5084121.1 ubiquinone/menaquinone biosynthesis C-methylase UbiE [Nonomuraea endophytica]